MEKVFLNIKRLKSFRNIHIHLDLIAGLPYEDYISFRKSFDSVYGLCPDQLQLGFLKMLKGSRIRKEAGKHGYEFISYPPYEVLSCDYLNYSELLELKGIEELVERYFNSHRFVSALPYIIGAFFSSPFEFFMELYRYYYKKGIMGRQLSAREWYMALIGFFDDRELFSRLVNELLKLDFLASDNSNNVPRGIERHVYKGFKERCFEFLKSEDNIYNYLPGFSGIPAKQIFKKVHFEVFGYDVAQYGESGCIMEEKVVVLFDYSLKDRVTGLYRYMKLEGSFFSLLELAGDGYQDDI